MSNQIRPILDEMQRQTLQLLNSKKKEDRDPLELKLGARLKEIEFQINISNTQRQELEKKLSMMKEALQKAVGAYEGFVDLLRDHYAEQAKIKTNNSKEIEEKFPE